MSSAEENTSESEESCEESERPTDSKKYDGRGGRNSSSESNDSGDERETIFSTTRNDKTIDSVHSSEEESEKSESESESSTVTNHNAAAVKGSQSSGSDTESLIQPRQPKQKTLTAKSSSHEQFQDSHAALLTIKQEISENESDYLYKGLNSQDDSFYSEDIKEECFSSSNKSESNDSDSNRELSDDEGLFDGTDLIPQTQEVPFSFSEENLINYSSGVINLEEFSNHNDFWLVHCPKIVSEEELQGSEVNFASETRLKMGRHRLQTTIYPEKGVIACAMPSHQLKQYFVVGLPVKGSVVFEESVKLPKPVSPHNQSESEVEFPTKLKERHPLFGADYKERLRKMSEWTHLLKTSQKRRSKGKDRKSSRNESIFEALLQPKVEKVSEDEEQSSDHLNERHSQKEESRKQRKISFSEKSFNGEESSKHSKKRRRDKQESDLEVRQVVETFKVKKRKVDKEEELTV